MLPFSLCHTRASSKLVRLVFPNSAFIRTGSSFLIISFFVSSLRLVIEFKKLVAPSSFVIIGLVIPSTESTVNKTTPDFSVAGVLLMFIVTLP